MMNSISFRRNIERQWTAMRNDLNRLADTFDLPGLAGGGWTGERPTGPRGNIPNWARGTFYGRNPQTGGSIAMTIDRSGDVSISFDGGAPIYASMNGTTLRNGQYTSRVSRITNGIRTTDVENGSYIDYFTTPNYGGGYYPPPSGGGNVPSWAVGTFQARNPENGGNITMTIDANGSVTLSYDNGAPSYASLNGTTLRNGPYTSRISQTRNGIRTTDVNNGNYIDYTRSSYNPGGGGYYPQPGGNVPNWAIGTFRARNPESGGTIIMTINRNGSVTIVFDNGSPTYATLNGTTLTNGPYVSRISEIRNGIRTTDVNNGSFIDYRRQ
jgi:hypothetical protein